MNKVSLLKIKENSITKQEGGQRDVIKTHNPKNNMNSAFFMLYLKQNALCVQLVLLKIIDLVSWGKTLLRGCEKE